jgi:hypothetical protein
MVRTLEKTSSPLFNLQDSSISKVDIHNAVSRSLLVSSAATGQYLLNVVRHSTGLTAATFNFAEYNSVFSNPYTYPQSTDADNWIELLVHRGFVLPKVVKNNLEFSPDEINFSDGTKQFVHSTRRSFEKIGGADVSLNLYDSISDLRGKFDFDKGVSSFLLGNEMLIQFLKNAYFELDRKLPKSIYSLEIRSDQEIENWITLFLNITPLENVENFEIEIQKFISGWMFKQPTEIRRLITIVDRII